MSTVTESIKMCQSARTPRSLALFLRARGLRITREASRAIEQLPDEPFLGTHRLGVIFGGDLDLGAEAGDQRRLDEGERVAFQTEPTLPIVALLVAANQTFSERGVVAEINARRPGDLAPIKVALVSHEPIDGGEPGGPKLFAFCREPDGAESIDVVSVDSGLWFPEVAIIVRLD